MPKRKLLFAAVFFLLSLCVSGGAAGAETIALYVDRLIDGSGGAPVKNAVIVIDGNRVKAAGPHGGVEIPAGAKAVRTKGATAMPGLVDSHVHYKDWQGEPYPNPGVTPAPPIRT